MKKTYEAPEILFEDFTMSTSIAANCDKIVNNSTENVCGYKTRTGIIFVEGITGCVYKQPDGYDGVCYHIPTDTTDLFNS